MKKIKHLLCYTCFVLLCVAMTSCGGKEKDFDPSLIPGKWKQGTLFDYYNADGTGHTWDEADDVFEEEAQKFNWKLENDQLTQIHLMEISGAEIPKRYTVTELTATSFKYKDSYGKTFSFTKTE